MRPPLVLTSFHETLLFLHAPFLPAIASTVRWLCYLFGPLAFGAVEPWSMFHSGNGSSRPVRFLDHWAGASRMRCGWPGILSFFPMLCFAALIAVQIDDSAEPPMGM